MTPDIALKRGYEPPDPRDGIRVLVDRLWLRGISKDQARLDAWMKDLGPSSELRTWFGHQAERWEEFQRRYREELEEPPRPILLTLLRSAASDEPLTLVYGAADTERNAAVVVRDTLLGSPPAHPVRLAEAAETAIQAVAAAQPDGLPTAEHVVPFLRGLDTPQAISEAVQGLVTETPSANRL